MRTFTIVAFVLLMVVGLSAQEPYNACVHDVIAYLKPGVITLPQGETEALIGDVTISNSTLAQTLAAYDVFHVRRAFPEFEASDSLMVSKLDPSISFYTFNFERIFVFRSSLLHLSTRTWPTLTRARC